MKVPENESAFTTDCTAWSHMHICHGCHEVDGMHGQCMRFACVSTLGRANEA